MGWLIGGLIALAMGFGGATRQAAWSDALVQLVALPCLGWVIIRLWDKSLLKKAPVYLTGAVFVIFLLQLFPLPPAVWTYLGGRETFAADLQVAKAPLPWMPISLAPPSTWRCLMAVLPAATVFLSGQLLSSSDRRRASLIVLALSLINVFFVLTQMAPSSWTGGQAIGLFWNRNHLAGLLDCCIPLAAAWGLGLANDRWPHRTVLVTFIGLAFMAAIIGIAVAGSRAGLILGVLGGLGSLALAWRARRRDKLATRSLVFPAAAVALVGLLLLFQFGFVGFANRFENQSVLEDLRWTLVQVTWRALQHFLPFGSGFGTFEQVYQAFEPKAVVVEAYVDHAHNDWLELLLEGGVPVLALILATLAWMTQQMLRVWTTTKERETVLDGALPRAGSLMAGLLLLHSVVDYPLRTTALMVVLAFSGVLMTRPAVPSAPLPGERGRTPSRSDRFGVARA